MPSYQCPVCKNTVILLKYYARPPDKIQCNTCKHWFTPGGKSYLNG